MLISSDVDAHRREIQKFIDLGFVASTCTMSAAISSSGLTSSAKQVPTQAPLSRGRLAGGHRRGDRRRAAAPPQSRLEPRGEGLPEERFEFLGVGSR